jgi:hypothetical protein
MTPDQRSHLAPPTDEQDVCYMHHDVCYANARCNNAGCNKKINQAEGSCDMDLYYCLKGLVQPKRVQSHCAARILDFGVA